MEVPGNVVQLHGHLRELHCKNMHKRQYTLEDAAHIAREEQHVICDVCTQVQQGLRDPFLPTEDELKILNARGAERLKSWVETVNDGIEKVCCIIQANRIQTNGKARRKSKGNGLMVPPVVLYHQLESVADSLNATIITHDLKQYTKFPPVVFVIGTSLSDSVQSTKHLLTDLTHLKGVILVSVNTNPNVNRAEVFEYQFTSTADNFAVELQNAFK